MLDRSQEDARNLIESLETFLALEDSLGLGVRNERERVTLERAREYIRAAITSLEAYRVLREEGLALPSLRIGDLLRRKNDPSPSTFYRILDIREEFWGDGDAGHYLMKIVGGKELLPFWVRTNELKRIYTGPVQRPEER